jgi:GNAT superfamily N-acetyltransferase
LQYVIEPLSRRHDRKPFDCGQPALNDYLQRYARQNEESGVGRTYVAVADGSTRVVGFYALSPGSVEFEDVPDALRSRLPRYPIPVAHLGRVAACRSVQGQGLGGALLYDAIYRTVSIADDIGIVAIEVWAKTAQGREFYLKHGFHTLVDDELHLYLPLATGRQLIEEAWRIGGSQLAARGRSPPDARRMADARAPAHTMPGD